MLLYDETEGKTCYLNLHALFPLCPQASFTSPDTRTDAFPK